LYFACVNEDSQDQCQLNRTKAIKDKLEKYPCAVLETFKTKKECLENNYRVMNANAVGNFCELNRLHH
jgi:hypothetical protein